MAFNGLMHQASLVSIGIHRIIFWLLALQCSIIDFH